jgi:hypothetical protein
MPLFRRWLDAAEGMIVTEGGCFGGYGLFLSKGVLGIRYGKPVFLYNLLELKRTIWEGPELKEGKHTIVLDFKFDGGGFGKGGTGTLIVDGKEVNKKHMEHTTPIMFPEDEDFDIGQDKLQGAQKESILELARYFSKRFGESCIKFHREGPNVTKTCPGSGISKADFLEEVRQVGKLYNDVPDDRWSGKYLEAADKMGFVNPDEKNNFRPKDPLTREEAAVIAVRIYEAATGKTVVK